MQDKTTFTLSEPQKLHNEPNIIIWSLNYKEYSHQTWKAVVFLLGGELSNTSLQQKYKIVDAR